ncbi:alpha/beta hydrolase [Proteinivorax tanatarense]|uniref:Alpha/beta hydrolase n=1 Tax=Proteinivorax tanatarense TaxID=1260629 RepID=A0AAU7VLD9_9FIRM
MEGYIYNTPQGENVIKKIYDKQVKDLAVEYDDVFINTRFGKTHILRAGNADGKPILFFHDSGSNTAISLLKYRELLNDYMIYAVDTIGQPGKSEQRVLSTKNQEYGQWASDIICSLGFDQMICMGESFGGGILLKLMSVAPEKVSKGILFVPAGFVSTSKVNFIKKVSLRLYGITGAEKLLEKALAPFLGDNGLVDKRIIEMTKVNLEHVKNNIIFTRFNKIQKDEISGEKTSFLIFTGGKDEIFSGKKLAKRAKKMLPNAEVHLLKDSSHFIFANEDRKRYIRQRIDSFIKKQKTRSVLKSG